MGKRIAVSTEVYGVADTRQVKLLQGVYKYIDVFLVPSKKDE
jgi:hypothetical protein